MKLTDKQFRLLNVILIIGSIVFLPLLFSPETDSHFLNWFAGFLCFIACFIVIFLVSVLLIYLWNYIQKGECDDPFEKMFEYINKIYKIYKKFLKE